MRSKLLPLAIAIAATLALATGGVVAADLAGTETDDATHATTEEDGIEDEERDDEYDERYAAADSERIGLNGGQIVSVAEGVIAINLRPTEYDEQFAADEVVETAFDGSDAGDERDQADRDVDRNGVENGDTEYDEKYDASQADRFDLNEGQIQATDDGIRVSTQYATEYDGQFAAEEADRIGLDEGAIESTGDDGYEITLEDDE